MIKYLWFLLIETVGIITKSIIVHSSSHSDTCFISQNIIWFISWESMSLLKAQYIVNILWHLNYSLLFIGNTFIDKLSKNFISRAFPRCVSQFAKVTSFPWWSFNSDPVGFVIPTQYGTQPPNFLFKNECSCLSSIIARSQCFPLAWHAIFASFALIKSAFEM